MPPENVLPNELNELLPQTELNYNGVLLVVANIAPNSYQIIRIFSTDPNDYLLDGLQPGQIINLALQNQQIN